MKFKSTFVPEMFFRYSTFFYMLYEKLNYVELTLTFDN